MSTVIRTAASVLIGITLLAVFLFWRPAWLGNLGLDPGDALEGAEALGRANQRAEALETWHETIQNRIQTKEAVLRGLIERRLTLAEGAARVKPLIDTAGPRYQQAFRRAYRGKTDEEKICRHLIIGVWDTLKDTDRARADEEVARLEAELQEHLHNSAP